MSHRYVIVTGGAVYVGSALCVALIEEGYTPVIIDNLSNSSLTSVGNIKRIPGHKVDFLLADIRDRDSYAHIFASRTVYAVIHCAGLKSISDSIENPMSYYDTNIRGTIALLSTMNRYNCKRIIFSSTAAVYESALGVSEKGETESTTPYVTSKLTVESLLEDIHDFMGWTVTILRYFNPAGAHPSGLLGEKPTGTPSNLIPYVSRVAANKYDYVKVYGDAYATPDGTGMRDYIHIMDLAYGHTTVLLNRVGSFKVYNLGTGKAHTVLEVIEEFKTQCGGLVPYNIEPRRKGDVGISFADYGLINNEIGWEPEFTLKDIVRDQLKWENNNG